MSAPRWINLFLLALVLALLAGVARGGQFPDRYDTEIREAADKYMPAVDWRLYKAQLYQESQLDPDAVSPVGARGIAQVMPSTWDRIAPAVGAGAASPHVAEPAILAGAYYMGWLRSEWSAPRPEADRHSLAMASYNAGLGHLLEAQRRCGGPNLYGQIVACLPAVTGEHATETKQYTRRIWRFWKQMVLGN